MEQKFYYCERCGNIVVKVKDVGVPIKCCGENMKELIPGTTEAATEKHIPIWQVDGDNKVYVTVGSTEHPMESEHSIEWVWLQTKQGMQCKRLTPDCPPRVCFELCEDDKVEAVYAYCNLHGLWKA